MNKDDWNAFEWVFRIAFLGGAGGSANDLGISENGKMWDRS